MRRIPIQIDEKTYSVLRKRAFEEKRSIASIVRECIDKAHESEVRRSITDFPFVASGRSRQGSLAPVSRNHDRALAEAVAPRRRRK